MRDWVRAGKITLGHAKLLVGVQDSEQQEQTAQRVVEEGLSVRALEQLLNEMNAKEAGAPPAGSAGDSKAAPGSVAHIRDLEQSFTRQLGMRVQIRASAVKGKGKLIIQYQNLDEFDSLRERLGVRTE